MPRTREEQATLVYSSGTGGRAKGCMLSHGAYLAQLDALVEHFPMAEGDRYFSVLPDEPCDRLYGRVLGASGVWRHGGSSANVAPGRCCGGPCSATASPTWRWFLCSSALFGAPSTMPMDERPSWQRDALDLLASVNARVTQRKPVHGVSRWLLKPIHDAFGGKLRLLICGGSFTDRAARRGVLPSRDSRGHRVRAHRGVHRDHGESLGAVSCRFRGKGVVRH